MATGEKPDGIGPRNCVMILLPSNHSLFEGIISLSPISILCFRYSPFLLACYKPGTEEFQSVCRVMSGFSDSFYIEVRY